LTQLLGCRQHKSISEQPSVGASKFVDMVGFDVLLHSYCLGDLIRPQSKERDVDDTHPSLHSCYAKGGKGFPVPGFRSDGDEGIVVVRASVDGLDLELTRSDHVPVYFAHPRDDLASTGEYVLIVRCVPVVRRRLRIIVGRGNTGGHISAGGARAAGSGCSIRQEFVVRCRRARTFRRLDMYAVG